MVLASPYPDEPRPARPLRTAMIIAALAFLGGLALMAWALTQWEPMKRFVRGNDPAPVAVQTATNRPLVAASPSGMIAADAPPVAPTTGQSNAVDTRISDLEGRMARIDLRAAGYHRFSHLCGTCAGFDFEVQHGAASGQIERHRAF